MLTSVTGVMPFRVGFLTEESSQCGYFSGSQTSCIVDNISAQILLPLQKQGHGHGLINLINSHNPVLQVHSFVQGSVVSHHLLSGHC